MADKPHKKRSLTLYKKGARTVTDRQKKNRRHLLDYDFLTHYASPLYVYDWKGYGHNNAIAHTMTNFASINTAAADSREVLAGDLVAAECVPGRQCYFEFNALPLYNAYSIPLSDQVTEASWLHPNTFAKAGSYRGYAMSLVDLMSRAMYYSRPSLGAGSSNQVTGNENYTNPTTFQQALNQIANYDGEAYWNAFMASQPKEVRDYLNAEFVYEGGYQEHCFTNMTTEPIYVFVREFMPKKPLNHRAEWGNFGVTGGSPVADINGWAFGAPGLYESITFDYIDQHKWGTDLTVAPFKDQTKVMADQLDDKAFKYNKYMKLTNSRFIVGEEVKKRIDPGSTFRYRMNLPSFKFKASEVFRWVQFQRIHLDGDPNTRLAVDMSLNQLIPAFWPKFSKHVQIRMVGSNGGVVQKVTNTSQSTWTDRDTFADVRANLLTTNGNTDTLDPNGFAGTGNGVAQGSRTYALTAPVAVTHTMSEHHACRMLPVCEPVHKEFMNLLPNATDKTEVVIGDKYNNIDPAENAYETNPAN